jgi:hypothetical protein
MQIEFSDSHALAMPAEMAAADERAMTLTG